MMITAMIGRTRRLPFGAADRFIRCMSVRTIILLSGPDVKTDGAKLEETVIAAVRLSELIVRPKLSLAAENLFLRKQLVLPSPGPFCIVMRRNLCS
jgi:hypothetical protein